jgi:hypothetical protein
MNPKETKTETEPVRYCTIAEAEEQAMCEAAQEEELTIPHYARDPGYLPPKPQVGDKIKAAYEKLNQDRDWDEWLKAMR